MQQAASLSDKDLFLNELRSVTAPAHKKLEDIPLSQAIVNPAITPGQYALYLSKMQSFVAAFENELFPQLHAIFLDIESRRKSSWLEEDLQALKAAGVQLPAIEPVHFEKTVSQPWLAGAMYVLEGSTLGGKFIYKNINSALSFSAENGAAYFNGYGADTGKQWSGFLEALCHYANAENKNEIYKGADDTFKLLFDILSK